MVRRFNFRHLQLSWASVALLITLGLILSYPRQAAVIGFGALLVAASIYFYKISENSRLEEIRAAEAAKRKHEIAKARLDVIDAMNGDDFEDYVAGLLDILGYETEVTQRSRDGGADVIAVKDGERIAIQTKRYGQAVGIKAVQEAIGGMYRYHCNKCMVVTNNTYSKDAIELAAKSPCILVDRDGLVDLSNKARLRLESLC